MATALSQRSRRLQPDWELEAEIEYWRREFCELASPSGSVLGLLDLQRAEAEAELDRRRYLTYARARRPFADLGPLIAEVKQRYDLVALFDRYAGRKRTQTYQTRPTMWYSCTFHDGDNEPSMRVWPDERRWWCFGCQHGGDAITAVMRLCDLTFVQAVIQMAGELGIAVPERPRRSIRAGAKMVGQENSPGRKEGLGNGT